MELGQQQVGHVQVHRWLDKEHNIVVAHGDFSAFLKGYLDHTKRWDRVPDPLISVMMSQGLSAAALYLSCRPRDENVGWTLSFRQPLVSVFFTGDAGCSSVTGRFFDEGINEAKSNRLYVQANRQVTGPIQSTIEIDGLDILDIFEQFYVRSEQHPARLIWTQAAARVDDP